MNPEQWQRIRGVFDAVIERPPVEREALLEQLCGDDGDLRRDVASLLASHDSEPEFLEQPALRLPEVLSMGFLPTEVLSREVLPTSSDASPERGTIGQYRIVRAIQEGGMGVVYLGVRDDAQFHQQVAIKRVKPGMDNDEVLRRFRAERQILASLDHPNIARLLDGGRSDDGRPYFVMEYVDDGVRIDEYCDRHQMSVAERLQLFRTVCDAVHYAHQNLVVHRDLKPSNILVSAQGQVKLLDFGIAKLLDPDTSEITIAQTRTGAWLMTPECASPEQARGESITTASDVYALGVLLYVLLSGHQPHQFETRSPQELVRVICDQMPKVPSAMVGRSKPRASGDTSAVTATLEHIGEQRGTTVERLQRRLQGDLDNIVLKALRKHPQERYASVQALSDDVLRALEHRPVLARKGTMGYVLRKFVRRHRLGVTASVLVLLSLLLGIGGVAWQARIARAERDRARQETAKAEQVTELLVDLFNASDPTVRRGAADTPVRDILRRGASKVLEDLEQQPAVQAKMLHVLGRVYHNLGSYPESRQAFERALHLRRTLHREPHAEVTESLHAFADLLLTTQDFVLAENLAREALRQRQQLFGPEHPLVALSQILVADVSLRRSSMFDEAERLYRHALHIQESAPQVSPLVRARTMTRLARCLSELGEYAEAETLYRQALELHRGGSGSQHLEVARISADLSSMLWERGEFDEAEDIGRDTLETRRQWLGDEHPDVADSLTNLGSMRWERGDYQGSLPLLRRALQIWRHSYGDIHDAVAMAESNLGVLLSSMGRYRQAEEHHRLALAIRLQLHGEGHRTLVIVQNNLAVSLVHQGRFRESDELFQAALQTWRAHPGEHKLEAIILASRGESLLARSRLDEAEASLGASIELYRTLFLDGHPELAAPLVLQARLLLRRNHPVQAEELAREAARIERDKRPAGHWYIARAESVLAAALLAQGRLEEAEPMLRVSYRVLLDRMGVEHASTKRARGWLHELAAVEGRTDRADPSIDPSTGDTSLASPQHTEVPR